MKKINQKSFLNSEKGITGLTLILFIIAILMLAGALGFALYSKIEESNQIAIVNITNNETKSSTKKSTSKVNWIQSKTEVTNGNVTLEVGSEVTGYEANGIDEWYVLGAEAGKLLITTNKGDEKVELRGKEGYENGVEILNNAVKDIYDDGDMAESVRSINVEDVNRVTGFDPDSYEEYGEYGKEYTYEDEGTFYDGEKWITLEHGESITLKRSYYSYNLMSMIERDCKAYKMLTSRIYCLANTCYKEYILGSARFGIFQMNGFDFSMIELFDSKMKIISLENDYDVLPVVSLKPDIQINSNGEILK